MTDKTPVEKVDEMYDMMKTIQQQLAVMDVNIKMLNSKANGELFAAVRASALPAAKVPSQIAADLDAKPTIGVPTVHPAKSSQPTAKRPTTRVQGKMTSDDGRPLPGITVKIISQTNNKTVEETRTNNAGVWTKFLRPGKYIAKYIHEARPTQFRLFEVKPGQEQMTVQ